MESKRISRHKVLGVNVILQSTLIYLFIIYKFFLGGNYTYQSLTMNPNQIQWREPLYYSGCVWILKFGFKFEF